jgi:hypothetical protein
VHLRAPAAFGPIVARSCATFRRRLERAAIENGGRRQGVASLGHSQHLTKVMHNGFEHLGLEPALALLVHRMSGRQIVRHQAPRGPRSDDPAQAIEDLPQAMLALGASSIMRVRYGATKAHSSSLTSLG